LSPLPSRERADAEGGRVRGLSQEPPSAEGSLLRQMPYDAGGDIVGTIGGGQLEFEAIAHARALLSAHGTPWLRDLRTWPLGPSLGQCCGGVVRLLFERYGEAECAEMRHAPAAGSASLIVRPVSSGEPLRMLTTRQDARDLPLHIARVASDMLSGARPRQAAFIPARKSVGACFIEPARASAKPLFVYGAGHVGRAIVKAIADLDFAVNWVDVHADRFPHPIPDHATPIVAQDPVVAASAAPDGAYHLVLTYSHALDLAICHTLLAKPHFGFLGLIGSGSKRARFMKRLGEAGIPPATLARLTCPIGIGSLAGKEPATIAISVAAQLIERLESERGSGAHDTEGTLDESGRISA
ncbi:MAG TPA: xanthine dehydrogenase accessory protein XdhC, partial [Hyphomicrobiales bacterium]